VQMGWHAGRAWFEPIIARLGGDGLGERLRYSTQSLIDLWGHKERLLWGQLRR
jgi:hypothetical protein